jgi:hypothetical protein
MVDSSCGGWDRGCAAAAVVVVVAVGAGDVGWNANEDEAGMGVRPGVSSEE